MTKTRLNKRWLVVTTATVPMLVFSVLFALLAGVTHSQAPQSPPNSALVTTVGTHPKINFVKVDPMDSGLTRRYMANLDNLTDSYRIASGIAAADIDDDGDIDLYVVGGVDDPNALYINNGQGFFTDYASDYGVDLNHWGSGPSFGDIDGDGDLDLFVGSIEHEPVYLFKNRISGEDATGEFENVTVDAGFSLLSPNTISSIFVDYDFDGLLDVFLTHWGSSRHTIEDPETLWKNEGDGVFRNVSVISGLLNGLIERNQDWTFTPSLADIDGDHDLDLLMAADFGTSQIFKNYGNNFVLATDRQVITDQAGMGSAVGDFDNDGDFDWFVTSIYNLNYGGTLWGNRLYQNDGHGNFRDVTDAADVSAGDWGWAACTKDFDHDGDLDMFHVSGWNTFPEFKNVRSRFHRNFGDGRFDEIALSIGLDDKELGRGVACTDFDGDGDIDIAVVNVSENHLILYRNETTRIGNYLTIKLRGSDGNSYGIGAKVELTTSNGKQIRQLGGSNNFVSHNPLEVHFGLNDATTATVKVIWPDQTETTQTYDEVNQTITIHQPGTSGLRLNVQFGDGDGRYNAGDTIAIEADEADEGYYFSHWTSNVGDSAFGDPHSRSTTYTMPSTVATVTAHYLPGVSPTANVSVARRWNEVALAAIRNDYARPTVHARNLFHISAAMYDAWAGMVTNIDIQPNTWLLGKTVFSDCPYNDPELRTYAESDIETALSYASYRIIRSRFARSPKQSQIYRDTQALMSFLDLDTKFSSTDYSNGSPAAIGNYIGECYLSLGRIDGANEQNDYRNRNYVTINPSLEPDLPGNPNIVDLNRWQPLALPNFIDQAGNPVDEQPEFLSPEWGDVYSFSLQDSDKTQYTREGEEYIYNVYHDPGEPPKIDGYLKEEYHWSHSMVSVWSSHLDPTVGRGADLIDISPAGIGNIADGDYPTTFEGHREFFQDNGMDPGTGHDINPITNQPYEPQMVPLGDYTRVLAEFWADGPDSETPPGHWYVILNTVNDHPDSTRKLKGEGIDRPALEWDVIGYFTLGGAMHDAAITAWSIKGWYDYIRPISSIRAMADLGQSSDPDGSSYHKDGLPLKPGYIELVEAGDALAGEDNGNVGKIKVFAWRGPDYIDDPELDVAGVGWILAENWWPYQRPTFVTPPFAGYVSGHSTYSRAAAIVLTNLTGSEFFPGGMSSFEAEKDNFLVFEKGPTISLTLEWATYQDAADQCSLSRIWGGIHPPIDDIPGRLIGSKVGKRAFEHAMSYIEPEEQEEAEDSTASTSQ